jgi:N-acyl-D-aspartate/D-glutamate deacylase
MRHDLLIRGARIVDGSGGPASSGDLAVRGDRIAAISPSLDPADAGRVVEAGGRVLAPGFVDVHSHDDVAVLLDHEMAFKTSQGVTTEVVGNCGFGPAPRHLAAGFGRNLYPGRKIPDWDGHAGYLARIDADPPSLNVAALVGHGTLRSAAMGSAKRRPTGAELEEMVDLLREGLEAGAVGFSSGLIYEPGLHAETAELVALARATAGVGGLYATHMRNESLSLVESVAEAIRIGEEGGVPVQISHHKASGRLAWGLVERSLERIDEARRRGLDVTADQYPYTAGSTILAAVIGGLTGQVDEDRRMPPEDVVLVSCPGSPEVEGRSFADLARESGEAPGDIARRLVDENGGKVWVVMHLMCEDDVCTVLRHGSTMIGSDGIPMDAGKPHPRLYGTFPRVLGHYVRERGVLGLEEAVHRMTGMPAAKFRLEGRGLLREGWYADLVLFDPDAIADRATYAEPRRTAAGIAEVWVNGTTVFRDGRHTGARPGRAARRASSARGG